MTIEENVIEREIFIKKYFTPYPCITLNITSKNSIVIPYIKNVNVMKKKLFI